jgi:hypothetical protein
VRVFGAYCRFVVETLNYLVCSLIHALHVGTRDKMSRFAEKMSVVSCNKRYNLHERPLTTINFIVSIQGLSVKYPAILNISRTGQVALM